MIVSNRVPNTRGSKEFGLAAAIYDRQRERGATVDGALAYIHAVFDIEKPGFAYAYPNPNFWMRATCKCGQTHKGYWF